MNKSQHICFFSSALKLGGVGKLTINLASEMISRGIKVDLFLSNPVGEYMDQIPEGVRLFYGNGKVSNSAFRFCKYLKKEKPDAVISARDYINIVNIVSSLLMFTNSKTISSVHVDYSEIPNIDEGFRAKIIKVAGKVLYPLSDEIIAVSDGVAKNHAKRMELIRDDISVIYNPVYNPNTVNHKKGSQTHEWLENKQSIVILGVGRLNDQKNFSLLINSFSILRKRINCKLIIIGEGDKRGELENLIYDLNLQEDVSLPGFVDNPTEFMRKSDLFVMSSSWEGFGNVIVEALGVGTPVVSTDCKSGPAEILENGKFGELVPVNDSKMLAKAMEEMVNKPTPSNKLIERAQDFSVDNITDQYLKLIYE